MFPALIGCCMVVIVSAYKCSYRGLMELEILLFCCCKTLTPYVVSATNFGCVLYKWLPPQIGSFLLRPFVFMVSPPPPIGEPLTPLCPPSSHLKVVVIPSAIVFYLTEMYKCLHILLSGRPCSEHQAERRAPRRNKLQKPDFNSLVPSST